MAFDHDVEHVGHPQVQTGKVTVAAGVAVITVTLSRILSVMIQPIDAIDGTVTHSIGDLSSGTITITPSDGVTSNGKKMYYTIMGF